MPAYGVIGAQWGDEGKGKVVDYLASNVDMVVRFSGGNNAGHTVINSLGEFKLHVVQAVDEGGTATFNNPGAPKFMAYEDRATAGLILAVRI